VSPEVGIVLDILEADESRMLWPVAALAVALVGFALFYGSLVQSRFERARDGAE
jgi:uncharacterized membrane protein